MPARGKERLRRGGDRVVQCDQVPKVNVWYGSNAARHILAGTMVPKRDLVLPAPQRDVGDEWRFVVVNNSVIAGSAHDPTTRSLVPADLDSNVTRRAAQVAESSDAPADVYILDVCECDGELRLLELNPFGGADLDAANALAIVDAVSGVALNGKRGDEHDDWGNLSRHSEFDPASWVIRQIEKYDNGSILGYDSNYDIDGLGGLSTVQLDELEECTHTLGNEFDAL